MSDFCLWPVSYEACGAALGDPAAVPPATGSTGCSSLDSLDAEAVAAFERMASEMLWNWTDRIFGSCEVVARPCRTGCSSATRWMNTFWGRGPYPWGATAGSWVPLSIGGEWLGMGCGCGASCSCVEEGPSALRLPGPIASVTSVLIDGVLVPPSEYRVLNNRLLARVDGKPWPSCQDLLAPSSEVGTFEVTYVRGVAVPKGGQVAAGILACELAKAACGDADCQLPQRIQTVTRQGLTVGIVDAFQGLNDARTGIWLIDSWTSSVRTPTAKAKAGVRSPDYRGGGRSW